MKSIRIYDTTLRDGVQGQGISFTVEDKLKIVKVLDEFGVTYIEAGNPGSNPKDIEFFERVKNIKLKNAKLIAFGSTRRANTTTEEDANVISLLNADTEVVTIFGKSWDFQVTEILKTTLEENLKMIYDTVKFFKDKGKSVIFDAEHFFDGYKQNPEYALKTLEVALEAGADSVCLCDTKGGAFPMEVYEITKTVVDKFNTEVGIHCHNDNGMAVADSIMAVQAGAIQVQGTINGYGERCGNANLCTLIPNLQLLMGYKCVPDENLKQLTHLARFVSEIANVTYDERAPYVGKNAFSHKAGMHADAVNKNTYSYELIDPSLVGNSRTFLISEVAGRGTVLNAINEIDPTITKDSPETKLILDKLKEMEYLGYQYENAGGSLELLIRKVLGKYKPAFNLKEFKVIVNEPSVNSVNSSALIKVEVDSIEEIAAAEGDGPVHALDNAVRRVLERFYPQIKEMRLTDYKVRVLDSNSATAAKVRVIIESTDGKDSWSTIGVSTDIIEASWRALVDSIEYKLNKES
ncbi:2-isopropylmalate synthase [Thermoanaerobacter thermohydrosulfuricus]|uniref:Citramalate synthase n=3 Tax=Thermoanaerobacter TaxID=1754 RepID=I9KTX4_9THEO|nr:MULTISPECIES: citramalate synthase [Thermoanaerobacter]EIW00404.1 2-isopropylmalate synthase/homocitrate synthase family protein [Thermoanaerobacter siderophilus SR4]EMT38721.1 2-isopropylmalate synthase/homocitrate synthase family protein [Thermoanaerobacter thermohydrosulfuricus WC1]UZQ82267.1 citramalate synthase [Thermoanaerobacter sp. RKWS2]SDG63615.1 2-isopropylmalate synthase [Thermoanaerobacter thermohydrosulfuricus]SFE03274.1 2-isopropylmalate synthase [Thermoanaerobacter thermohyd